MPSTTASRFVSRSFVLLLACAAPVALSAAPPPAAPAEAKPLYKDASAPVDARVEDLLKRMTLEEKVAQLLTVWQEKTKMLDANKRLDPAKLAALYPDGLGGFSRPSDMEGPSSPRVVPARGVKSTVELVNDLQ
ncbi:MAG: beta-glucosidase, partial [Sphingomonas sp.]